MTPLITQVTSEHDTGARAIKELSAAVSVSRSSYYRHRKHKAEDDDQVRITYREARHLVPILQLSQLDQLGFYLLAGLEPSAVADNHQITGLYP